jgi:hypothetical protein
MGKTHSVAPNGFIRGDLMARLTVQFERNGEYGERVYKSEALSEQQMADEMYAKVLPGIALRFIGDYGIVMPTGYSGDSRLYIPAKVAA